MKLRVIAAAFALGCASSDPVVVSPADLHHVAIMLSGTAAAEPQFQVSEVRVQGREIHLDLRAIANGDGWIFQKSASCVRCQDNAAWQCSPVATRTLVVLPGGSVADAIGLTRSDAVAAVQFLGKLAASSPDTLSPADLASTHCLLAHDDRQVVVFLGATLHHATTSFGKVVLEREGQVYRLVSKTPPPSWFEGDAVSLDECSFIAHLGVIPEC